MKKSQTTSGQSAKHIKKWKYEEEMSFLRPHMRERDTISSLNILSDGENETNDESGIVEVEEGDNDLDINNSSITHLTNTESPTTSSFENKVRSQKLSLGQKELNKTNMRKRKQHTESASATLLEYPHNN